MTYIVDTFINVNTCVARGPETYPANTFKSAGNVLTFSCFHIASVTSVGTFVNVRTQESVTGVAIVTIALPTAGGIGALSKLRTSAVVYQTFVDFDTSIANLFVPRIAPTLVASACVMTGGRVITFMRLGTTFVNVHTSSVNFRVSRQTPAKV